MVKNHEIELLKESLSGGGGVVARKTVGEFLKGFRIAAGQDLKLEAFDITGLKDGDEVDPRLASVVQDSLAGSREDDRNIRLYARPPWYVPEETVRIGRCKAFWSRIFPCCIRKPKRWQRKLHFGEGIFACYARVQQVLLRLVYRSSSAMKQRDAFVSFQDSDKDIARWLRLFCDMRSLSVYAQLPNDAAKKNFKDEEEEPHRAERKTLRATARQNQRLSREGSIRGSVRKSMRSMGSALSQLPEEQEQEEQPEADGPTEPEDLHETAVAVDEDGEEEEVSMEKLLEEREHLIRTSRVLLVIASQDSLENAAVLQDCLWAFQWGVPVLPVRRVSDDKVPKELRKKLRFLYALKMGVPEVGLGTNRKDFFFKISSALAAGIRMGRSKKRKQLPRNVWDFFLRSVKHLQRDAKDLVSSDQLNIKEKPPSLTTHEARFCIEGGVLVDLPDLGKLQNQPELVAPKAQKKKRDEEKNEEKEAGPPPETSLSSAMEDRTYGILELLSLQGQQNLQVSTKAVNAIRTVTAVDCGSKTVATFGGVEVLLKLATFACQGAQEKKQTGPGKRNLFGRSKDQPASPSSAATASPRSPKSGRYKDASAREKGESPSGRGHWTSEESPESPGRAMVPKSARGRWTSEESPESARVDPKSAGPGRGAAFALEADSARDHSPKSARWRGGTSARDGASPETSPRSPRNRGSAEEPTSGRHPKSARGVKDQDGATPEEQQAKNKKPSKKRSCFPCRRKQEDLDFDDEEEHSDDEDQGHSGAKSGDSGPLFLRLADHSLATLRNLAAHSFQRKQQILEKKGEEVAIEALHFFRGKAGAEHASCSCAALLRNLSEGVDGVQALADAGFLQIAEDELEDGRGAPGVRLHFLAALQNMAACVDQSPYIFPYPEQWLELCAMAAQTAVEDKDARTTRQALAAMGNFAILRAAKEATDEDDRSDHGLPFAPLAHMTTAAAVAEAQEASDEDGSSSEDNSLEDLANKSVLRSKSMGSDIPSLPTDDQEMEHSLNKAYGKVPADIIQRMLDLIQVNGANTNRTPGDASISIATSAAATLANFAQDTDIERLIGSMGGIEMILEAITSVSAEEFQLQAVRFIWNMTFSKANQQKFMDNDGVGKILAAMQTYQKAHHSPLQEQGCGVLRNLAHGHSGRHKRALLKSGVLKAICEALRKFYQEINVCMQAVSALTALCIGAPPAALEAKKHGAARWLVSALKLTGDNSEITELILEALEALLLIPQVLTPFGRRGGHLEVLKVLDRFTTDTTVLMAFRTLAAALSHTNLKAMLETEKADGDKDVKSHSEEYWERMGKAPGTSIRSDLMENGLVKKVIDALQKFEEYTIAIEAGAGVLMNVALEVQEREEDGKHLQRKLDVGLACHNCLTIIGHLATSPEKMKSTGFVSNMFRLLAAVCLHEDIALLLHRKQAATKTLEYLKAFRAEPSIQASGCAFLGNLANSKLRIREAIVGVGSLEYLINELKSSKYDGMVVQSMCKALKDLSPAEAAIDTLRRYNIVDLVFEAADLHLSEATVMEASLAFLWTLSAIHRYAEELNRKDTTNRALEVLRRHRAHHEVCRCCGGLLRNLFAAPLSVKAADDCLAAGGLRLLLDALWQHCLPPVQGTMSQAAYALAKRGSMDSIGSAAVEGQTDPPKRAGSTLDAGNGINRAGSILGRRGSNLPQESTGRRTSVRRNSVRRQSDLDLSVKIFNLDAAEAVPTEEKMAVAEQILAALRNLVAFSKLSAALADEIYRSEEWDNLRVVVELYPKSIMVQYQGFELVGKLVTEKRELRTAFQQIADHVLLTNLNHKNTPVADVAELLLEALN